MSGHNEAALQNYLQKADRAFRDNKPGEAYHILRRGLKAAPDHPLLLLRSGNAAYLLGLRQAAESFFIKAIDAAPGMGEAHNNLGKLFLEEGRIDDAIVRLQCAARCLPHSPLPLIALSSAFLKLSRFNEAEHSCREAIKRSPNSATAHYNLALILLAQGRFEEGWQEYEWRWDSAEFPTKRREFAVPIWEGGRLEGISILVHAEQGLGDTIQYARFIQVLAERTGATVHVACHPELVALLSTLTNVSTVIPFSQIANSRADRHVPLISLPYLLDIIMDMVPQEPYLGIDPERSEYWRELLQGDQSFKIGIAWDGKKIPDPFRSCPLEELEPLFRRPGATFHSLQVGDASRQIRTCGSGITLRDHSTSITCFADTAALIGCLDLVISIDTSVAHCAGALGKETWMMLPCYPDWRWMLPGEEKTVWYPSVRIFRQHKHNSWDNVVSSIASALENRMQCSSTPSER